MEKITKEYYEKLKTINYNKVEITLYNKLKDYGIWWVRNRVKDAEDYFLYFNDKIKYLKKYIEEFLKECIKEYNEKDFHLVYNEKLEKYEAEYKKEKISMNFIYNEYSDELKRIEIFYKKEILLIYLSNKIINSIMITLIHIHLFFGKIILIKIIVMMKIKRF